ncbi:MAG: hypothetical protein CW338_04955 [Clostridiales bacterium]|nr:hypothetical protein [Clostridiales bacterium]
MIRTRGSFTARALSDFAEKRMKIKGYLIILICLFLCVTAAGEESGNAPRAWEPLSFDVPEAPYAPDFWGYDDNMMGYKDDSIDITIEQMTPANANILVITIRLSDVSQFRTAWAGSYPTSKEVSSVADMAEWNNAILAINSDFFAYHSSGIVYRNGMQIRMRPDRDRDTLIVDMNGDFHILAPTTQKAFDAYDGTILHAFCFGPALVRDGVMETNFDRIDLDIMKYKKEQRLAIGQLGPLTYVIVSVEGPLYAASGGMTIPEMAQFMLDLGCTNAYNLDGGNSTAVVLGGIKLNSQSTTKVREVGDILYFATLVPDQE